MNEVEGQDVAVLRVKPFATRSVRAIKKIHNYRKKSLNGNRWNNILFIFYFLIPFSVNNYWGEHDPVLPQMW